MLNIDSSQDWYDLGAVAHHAAHRAQDHTVQVRPQWMIQGRAMTFDQFLDEIAPGTDNPLRTLLILRYQQ